MFGDIRADVERLGPDPLNFSRELYRVRISSPGGDWVESQLTSSKEYRTAGTDFDLAMGALGSLYQAVKNPKAWRKALERHTRMSDEEINATFHVADRMREFLPSAMMRATQQYSLYAEAREGNVGPLEMGVSRRLELPLEIRNKEDIANFFAYLYLVEHTSFHPDDSFGEYVDRSGKAAYGEREASIRDMLMHQARDVAKKLHLNIYEVGLWVGALSGANHDPENEASAPKWLRDLSKTWA